MRWVRVRAPVAVGHSTHGGFQLVVEVPICYKAVLLMKRATQLLFLLPLLLAGGCAQWNPYLKNSKFHKVWGYPPKALGQALHIRTMNQLRAKDFQDEVEE